METQELQRPGEVSGCVGEAGRGVWAGAVVGAEVGVAKMCSTFIEFEVHHSYLL